MDFGLSEEQEQLFNTARSFLARECGSQTIRQAMADPEGRCDDLLRKIAELGWCGLIIPEKFGGAGLSMLDMALVLEAAGYAAMPGPFLFSSVVAAKSLVEGGAQEPAERWLPALAAGRAIGAVALSAGDAVPESENLGIKATRSGDGYVLNGRAMFVPYAHIADFFVLPACVDGRSDAVEVFVVERSAGGVSARPLRTIDETRRVCELRLEGVPVASAAKLVGGAALQRRLLDTAAVALAADSLGGTERVLDMAVEYSKVREQFGKPIGSFQAIKHAAAEIVAELEPTRALVWFAAYAHDALPDDAAKAAAMAKSRMSDVFSVAADKAVLMHGGIGFTWEHDIHIWFKRSRFNAVCCGTPEYHRARIADLSGY